MLTRMVRLIALVVLVVGTTSVKAVENGVLNYPQGISSPFMGFLVPIQGVFYLNQTEYQNNYALYGPNGQKLSTPFSLNSYVNASRLLISDGELPIKNFFVYHQLIFPTVDLQSNVAGQHSSAFGEANFTVTPFILAYNIDKAQTLATGLDVVTDLGTYRRNALSVASNYLTYSPTVIYRYNDPKGATFAVAPRFLFNEKNPDNGYRSATDFMIDFDAEYNFGKLRFGALGSYATQFGSDHLNGVSIADTRFENFILGPSVSYDFGSVLVNFNYQAGVFARNGAKGNTALLSVTFPLYVIPPAGGAPGFAATPPGSPANIRRAAAFTTAMP